MRIITAGGSPMPTKKKPHKLETVYYNMKARCYDDNRPQFKDWGGKGVVVCDAWLADKWEFIAWAYEKLSQQGLTTSDIGRSKHTLDRIDNDGPYAPWNCEFKNKAGQNRNRSNCRPVTVDGVTKTLAEWADYNGIPYMTIVSRIDKGRWDPVKAVTEVPDANRPKRRFLDDSR